RAGCASRSGGDGDRGRRRDHLDGRLAREEARGREEEERRSEGRRAHARARRFGSEEGGRSLSAVAVVVALFAVPAPVFAEEPKISVQVDVVLALVAGSSIEPASLKEIGRAHV